MDCRIDMVQYSAGYVVLEVLGMFEGTDGEGGSRVYGVKARAGGGGAQTGVGKELGDMQVVDIADPDMEDMVGVGGVQGRSEGQAPAGGVLDVVGVVEEGGHHKEHHMVVGTAARRDSALGAAGRNTSGWGNVVVVVVVVGVIVVVVADSV